MAVSHIYQLRRDSAPKNPPVDQLFGIEIEVENCHSTRWAVDTNWQCVEDGSLRNSGMEFISPPVSLQKAEEMLTQYHEAAGKLEYHATIRTGVHVHADMRQRSIPEVKAICALYAVLEPLLYQMCGEEREECIYCVPWYRAPDDAVIAGKINEKESRDTIRHRLQSTCKYSGMFLNPLRTLGTIEFRMAPTWPTLEESNAWVRTISRLVAQGRELATAEAVVDKAEANLPDLVETVIQPAPADYEALLDATDSVGVAGNLVRTRSTGWTRAKGIQPRQKAGDYYPVAGKKKKMIRPGGLNREVGGFIDIPLR